MTAARPPRVGGLVLAAGEGRRFGGPKALAELDGERLVDRAVRILRAGGCEPVLAVLGAAVVDVPGADAVVVNAGWAEGMGSSLRAGLTAPELAGCSAAVVLLVDQPGVRATAVRRLVEAHAAGAGLAVATYDGERGHPVLLGRRHWAGVAELAVGDVGARPYLAAHAEEVAAVDCTAQGSPSDADTPDELAGHLPGQTGKGVLGRIAGGAGASGGAGAAFAAGFDELGALLGGSGARARLEEKAAEKVRPRPAPSGQPPVEVDLDTGVARIRRPPGGSGA